MKSILFLCTGNSARSILAEFIFRQIAGERFEVASAGSAPKGAVHPLALEVLQTDFGVDPREPRSKSWHELEGRQFDFVVTLCDDARDSCPIWPGRAQPPVIAHWSMADPAAVEGSKKERRAVFRETARTLELRLERFARLPIETLDRRELEAAVRDLATR